MTNNKNYQVMPELTEEEYVRLKEDIAQNGLEMPIDVDERGNILDGYNRKKICDELGIPCEKAIHPGLKEEEKYDFALRVNVNRRHMTREQMSEVVVRFRKMHPELSNRAVAEAVGTNDHAVKNMASGSAKDSHNGEWPTAKNSQLAKTANDKIAGAKIDQPQKTTGLDGKERPADAEKAKEQREAVRNAIACDPDKSNRQIARETGTSHTTVAAQRKKMRSFHDLSARDEKALQDPDIVRRLEENEKLNVAGAILEQKREQLVEHLESVEEKEVKEAEGVYDVVVIDPPWPMQKMETDRRPAEVSMDYPVMTMDEIKALKIPAADDCHVFLWTTQKFLPEAFDVLKEWGARYVCTFVWHKSNGGYKPLDLPIYNCEFCLYARIGTPRFTDDHDFKTCFETGITGHSEKPEEFYTMLRRVTAGRRLDMFNRREIEGFDGWGKEADH